MPHSQTARATARFLTVTELRGVPFHASKETAQHWSQTDREALADLACHLSGPSMATYWQLHGPHQTLPADPVALLVLTLHGTRGRAVAAVAKASEGASLYIGNFDTPTLAERDVPSLVRAFVAALVERATIQ